MPTPMIMPIRALEKWLALIIKIHKTNEPNLCFWPICNYTGRMGQPLQTLKVEAKKSLKKPQQHSTSPTEINKYTTKALLNRFGFSLGYKIKINLLAKHFHK